jgi:hypothetical protein
MDTAHAETDWQVKNKRYAKIKKYHATPAMTATPISREERHEGAEVAVRKCGLILIVFHYLSLEM